MGGQLGRLFSGKTEEEIFDTLAKKSEAELIVIFNELTVTDLITKVPRLGPKYARIAKRSELWQPRYYALLEKEYDLKDINPPILDEERYENSLYPWYDRFIDLWINRPHIWRDSNSGKITGAAAWYRDPDTNEIVSYPLYWIELDKGIIRIVQSRKIEEECPDIYIQVPGMINTMFNLNDPTSNNTVPYDPERADITCVNTRYQVWERRYIRMAKTMKLGSFVASLGSYLLDYANQMDLINYYKDRAELDAELAYYFMTSLGSNNPFTLFESFAPRVDLINPFVPTYLSTAVIGATAMFALTHEAIFKMIIAAGIDLSHIDEFRTNPEISADIECLPVYILFTDASNTPENTRVVQLNRLDDRRTVVESPVYEHTEQSYLGQCISCGISSQLLYRSMGTDNIYCSSFCQQKME